MTELDLNHTRTKRELFSKSIADRVDAVMPLTERKAKLDAIIAELEANPPPADDSTRNYIGASAIGDECLRRTQLGVWGAFHPDKPPPRKLPLEEKSRIIFERGHRVEAWMIELLQAANFDLVPLNSDGYQFGFITGEGRIRGHADGIFRDLLPDEPALWENKCVNTKGFRGVSRLGLLRQYPKYDTQVQMLMAYLQLPASLVSFVNADTAELWFELVPFDVHRGQAASDRAVHILVATRAGDLLPKAGTAPDKFPCAYCDFREECWRS